METRKKMLLKFTAAGKPQAKPDGKIPKNPDVPKKGYDPKELQDKLPEKKR